MDRHDITELLLNVPLKTYRIIETNVNICEINNTTNDIKTIYLLII